MTFDPTALAPLMQQRAAELQAACPTVVFLSGRRDLESQAHAMACNVVTNRQWIAGTYLHAATLQTAVDLHPEATSVSDIEHVLASVLRRMSLEDLAHVSDHLTGYAVDLLPMEDASGMMTPAGFAVADWIRTCADTKAFFTREAGLIRWHWAVREPVFV